MKWNSFRDELWGVVLSGEGYHTFTPNLRINNSPTHVCFGTSVKDDPLWIPSMGFVWSSDEDYRRKVFTGYEVFLFSKQVGNVTGYKRSELSRNGGVSQISTSKKVALALAAISFAGFLPRYTECLQTCLASILSQNVPLDESTSIRPDLRVV